MKLDVVEQGEELLHLAEAALDEGRPTDALELCQRLLAEDPGDTGARFVEAEAYRNLRETHEAEDRYRSIVDHAPDHADAWAGLGSVLLDQCRFLDAARTFARALRLAPNHPDALYGRAMLRERKGDRWGSRRDYARAWQASARYPMPAPLDDEDVRRLLVDAALESDPSVAAFIQGAPILVVNLPETSACEAYDPPASPVELLGHFTASFEPDGFTSTQSTLPPALILYRRNLERYADDRGRLVHVLRDAVLSQVEDWISRAAVPE